MLSYTGRLCLVNLVITWLTSSLKHLLMLYRWPNCLLNLLTHAICNFIWTGLILNRNSMIMAWDACCIPVKLGRLRIKNSETFNKALVGNIAWKILSKLSFVSIFLRAQFFGRSYFVISFI